MDLHYLVKILLRKLWILLSIPLIVVVASYFFVKKLPDEYKSTAQLSTGFTSEETGNILQRDVNVRDAAIKFVNVIETMRSQIIVNQVAYKLLLHDLKSEVPFKLLTDDDEVYQRLVDSKKENIISILENKLNNFELLKPTSPQEKQIIDILKAYKYDHETLLENLQIYRVSSSDFLNISFFSSNPHLSAFVVNELANEFIKYHSGLRSNKSTSSLTYYSKLIDQKKRFLDEKNEELNNIKAGNIDWALANETKSTQISEYQLKRDDLNARIQALRIQIESIDNKLATLTEGVAPNNQKIIDLQNNISVLSKILNSGKYEGDSIQETLERLRLQLQLEINKAGKSKSGAREELLTQRENLEIELRIAQTNLKSTEGNLQALRSSVSGSALREAKIQAIQTEIDENMEQYLALLKEYNDERNKSLVSQSSIEVIVPGQPNEKPESSKKLMIVLLAGAASFTLCLFVVIGYEFIDLRLKTPSGFARQTKLKLAGPLIQISQRNIDLDAIFMKDKGKPEHELFKQFLRKIRFVIEALKDRKTLLVTSTKTGEGKSFVILCLAYSLSLLNKRVLIIDTNFKNNSLTRILMGSKHQNLLDWDVKLLPYKSGEEQVEPEDREAPKSIIATTGNRNIDIIGSKSANNSPSEIFSDKSLKKLLGSLSTQYDYVLMEGAALNEFSDTKELVEYVDGVIPVFSADSSLSMSDKRSISYLKALNGKLFGAILNKVDIKNVNL